MNRLISVFLLLTLCSQLLLKLGVVVSWKINQDYIIENLCINRNRPEMECNGKCCLQTQLKSVDESQTDKKGTSLPAKLKVFESDNYIENYTFSFFESIQKLSKENLSILNNLYSFDYLNTCFHPPQTLI